MPSFSSSAPTVNPNFISAYLDDSLAFISIHMNTAMHVHFIIPSNIWWKTFFTPFPHLNPNPNPNHPPPTTQMNTYIPSTYF
jgi:hypothetical protein